jgi:hypothetical protein
MDTLTAHRLLGLHAGPLSARQVDSAFRTRLWSAHPDSGGDSDALRRPIEARDLLRRAAEHPERNFAGSVRCSPVEIVDFRLSRRVSRGVTLWARARSGRRPRRVI